ncbi:hypothetical protein [Pedobacter foliorum]|uniref:hypothetical protein n=1 Tax=Pedobacter foliorum TaxID=2739058 RepID=UPI00156754CD|nr:hypothetical protein [Pedobacter foliorum]NRF42016.1 hypothetical protein [Pedobacter foliorum]
MVYKNKPLTIATIFVFFIFYSFGLLAQDTTKQGGDANKDLLFFMDGKEILRSGMNNINPDDIAMVTVLKAESSKSYGEKGRNGVILIETKVHCRQIFQKYLSSKSTKYQEVLTSNGGDKKIQYILNGKVLKNNYEGDLASIADSTFISVDVIEAAELKSYNVSEMLFGVVIKTKVKEKPVINEIPKSKFEPELLIISPGKISFDPSATKAIEEKNKALKSNISNQEQPDLSNEKAENIRLMRQSAIAYMEKLNFFNQIPMFSQNYLGYRFIERFPNTLILLKDITAENGLNDLAKIAVDEKMPYVLSFPSAHVAKEKGKFVLHLKVQLYEAESNSLVVDKEYTGDQINQGFEFTCDGSIQCIINNALSAALPDVILQIASNNRTLQGERILALKRFEIIKTDIFLKNSDPSLIKSVIGESDSTINLPDLYQTFYSDDKSKFVGFLFRKVDKQNLKGLSDSKTDHNVKILSGSTIRDKDFLDIPQNYAYIVKGVLSNGRWYYKKDMVTYFEAENESEGKLEYLNNLQGWGYFKEGLTDIDSDFWEGKLFEKIEDKRKHPDWDEHKDMWEDVERENRNYIGMYELVAERLKEEKSATEKVLEDSIANNIFKPFYDASIKSKQHQISGYKSALKDFVLIYDSNKRVIINPIEVKDDKGIVTVRYFVILSGSDEIYEWNYFPKSIKKKGVINNSVMENLATVTKWDYSYDTLDDEQFWNNCVLLKENGIYRYLKSLK